MFYFIWFILCIVNAIVQGAYGYTLRMVLSILTAVVAFLWYKEDRRKHEEPKEDFTPLRDVLLVYGKNSEKVLLYTNAPKDVLEQWARDYDKDVEKVEDISLDELSRDYVARIVTEEMVNAYFPNITDYINYFGYKEVIELRTLKVCE